MNTTGKIEADVSINVDGAEAIKEAVSSLLREEAGKGCQFSPADLIELAEKVEGIDIISAFSGNS